MTIDSTDLAQTIADTKRLLRESVPDLERRFAAVEAAIAEEVAGIVEERERGRAIVPSIAYADIVAGRVPGESVAAIRKRGAVVVRGTFPAGRAAAWNAQLGEYVERNGYYAQAAEKAGLDRYFSDLKSGKPQIFGIYWSKPQVEARQSAELARTRAFLNGLWRAESDGRAHFDPAREATYADRIRRREPGDATLGLSPHMDGGSVERWIDPAYRQVYRHVFEGDWQAYDPFDGAFRTAAKEIPSPAVCSMFRTYQGWTALTAQGPGDGTLQLIPIARGIAYMLLRALLADVAEDDLCGAQAGRALSASPRWHPALMPALSPIPRVEPGDTVWWHPDVVHAVEDRHGGTGYSNVVYIGAAPWCAKNAAYVERQKRAFLAGESAPDFAPESYEVAYEGRAHAEDLTELGRRQMGLAAW